DANVVNDGEVTVSDLFRNDGVVNNTGEGKGTLNVKDGYSKDALTQGIMTIAADNTSFENDAPMTIEKLLDVDGTLDNNNNINVENAAKDAILDNSGTVNSNSGSAIVANIIENTGDINLTAADLTANNQDRDIEGTINVLGTDPASDISTLTILGDNPNFVGDLNVGSDSDNSSLKFIAGNVTEAADVSIAQGSALNVDDSSVTDAVASLILDGSDDYSGDLNLYSGEVTMKDMDVNTGDKNTTTEGGTKPFYQQTGGELTLENSKLTMDDASKIQGGDLIVDATSTFVSKDNAFSVDNLDNAGEIQAINGGYENYNVNNTMTIGDGQGDEQGDFTLDLYARSNNNKKYDTYGSDNDTIAAANGKEATINVSDWTLNGDLFGKDAPIDKKIKISKLFKGTIADGHKINFTSTDKKVFTPIGWYQLKGGSNGDYSFDLVKYNPQVFRGQVTKLAQYQNQLAIDDMMFNHTMLNQGFKDNDTMALANMYASAGDLYAPYQYSKKDGGLWVKSYANFEKLNMNRGLSAGNNSYGVLMGADFGLKDLRHGWKFMPTAYVGYNGAHQHFQGVGAYQNGGQAGFLGTWYKDNFMIGALTYAGVYGNDMDLRGFDDDTFNYFAGASVKAAYNHKIKKNWALQPNFLVAYNFFGRENWHTDFGQMGMMSGMLHGVNIAPGLNLIWERETFSAYATVQYMYNVNQSIGGRAGNVNLPHVEMDRGYIQYGVGLNKKFGDRVTAYGQTVFRNAGRTGVGFQVGLNWKLGKAKKHNSKGSKTQTKNQIQPVTIPIDK
ncbi:hypothetical protein II906_10910, partial [bacterium]|nr:hypothetical protein [bacterium]